jgi:hypothetical protein
MTLVKTKVVELKLEMDKKVREVRSKSILKLKSLLMMTSGL